MGKMDIVDDDGVRKVSLSDLETYTQRDSFWLLRQCEDAYGIKLTYNDDYIEETSLRTYIKWHNANYSDSPVPVLPAVNKRAYSITHRIEIAYKSKYTCNACGILLPPTFEIDHIVELREGGSDTYENLQALCPNCHSLKTRANTLKKDKAFEKEFSTRAQQFENDAFAKFRRTS